MGRDLCGYGGIGNRSGDAMLVFVQAICGPNMRYGGTHQTKALRFVIWQRTTVYFQVCMVWKNLDMFSVFPIFDFVIKYPYSYSEEAGRRIAYFIYRDDQCFHIMAVHPRINYNDLTTYYKKLQLRSSKSCCLFFSFKLLSTESLIYFCRLDCNIRQTLLPPC